MNDTATPQPPPVRSSSRFGAYPDQTTSAPSVVIVDDAPANVTLLERLLQAAGMTNVRGFTDPRQAIAHCASSLPDLVLLDLHMPELDGVATMRALRELCPPGRYLPVIVLTADATPEARNRVLAAGAHDFLTKPFDRTEVLLRVGNLLETRALHDSLHARNEDLQRAVDVHDSAARQAQSDLDRRHRRLDRAMSMASRTIVYQPIADLASGEIMGAEALSRFAAAPVWPPDRWFAEAEALGRGTAVELVVISDAITRLGELPSSAFLSLNLSPTTAMSEELIDLLGDCAAERLVLELTEHAQIADYVGLLNALDRIRGFGAAIAVDDAGAGYAGFQHLLRIRPEIIKLDATLTRGVDADPARRALAAGLVTFAKEIRAVIIAEGIEIAGEMDTLRALGIPWGQGYYLSRPSTLPVPERVESWDTSTSQEEVGLE